MLQELKQLKTFLIALVLLSVGCAGAPKFPTDRIWEYDHSAKVCGEYKIVDPKKRQVRWIKDHPASKCQGMFGFSSSDIPDVLEWVDQMEEHVEKNCK